MKREKELRRDVGARRDTMDWKPMVVHCPENSINQFIGIYLWFLVFDLVKGEQR
jgi:hypothetical protein